MMVDINRVPVAKYGAESWKLNKDIAKRLATFERKVLRRMSEVIKVNENWRMRHKEKLMQLFGDSDTFSFLRISRVN
jgi:hypothetical protein